MSRSLRVWQQSSGRWAWPWARSLLADDQLAFTDDDRPVLHDVAKRQRPAHRRGEQAVVQAVGLGHQHGALGRDGGDRVQAVLAEYGDAG